MVQVVNYKSNQPLSIGHADQVNVGGDLHVAGDADIDTYNDFS